MDRNYFSALYFLPKMEKYNFGRLGEKTLEPYLFSILPFSPTKHP